MNGLDLITHSAQHTQRIGMRLGELAEEGDVFLLVGELGAGKTCLTQGIAWGLGVEGYATSPSFVVIREYHGRFPLYHVDLYRIDRIDEVLDLGLDDYLGRGVCVVEWARKALELLPQERMLVTLSYLDDTKRRLLFEPSGERYLAMLARLKSAI